jgi:SPP1 family predicted phage head-tail adaptor
MPHYFAESLRAGELNKRVTLQAPQYNSAGDEIIGHTDVMTVRAQMVPIRGRELVEANRDVSEQWTLMKIRYRAGLETTINRVVHGTTEYDVESIVNPHQSNRVLELTCRAVR